MEIFEINNLKPRLHAGEIITLSSEEDVMHLYFRESLSGKYYFFIVLNSKVITMNIRFRTFRDKVWDIVQKRNLKFQK